MASPSIIVDDPLKEDDEEKVLSPADALVGWVVPKVQEWADHRDTHYKARWDEYYRLWRGIWQPGDKTRESERSRLIAPALAQAIEATVAELEEATFGGNKWFDVFDNQEDEDHTDIEMFRDQLREDMEDAGVPSAVSEVFLNGTLYGTGIGKIVVEEVDTKRVEPRRIKDSTVVEMGVVKDKRVRVSLVSVHPSEFAIDTAARTIDEALGMAHIFEVPRWTVEDKIMRGVYRAEALGGFNDNVFRIEDQDNTRDASNTDSVLIIEYHGKVPRTLLDPDAEPTDENGVERLFDAELDVDEADLVEAIVTIANGTTLLRAVENPLEMQDRAFVAYQHDTVPNRFWGRGIAEKGYNPQKALDAEMRGRIDALALTIAPMIGIDATRIPRGMKFEIRPGRALFTQGDPNTVLNPFNFGQVNNNTFSQSGELERMVQMATGAMDSATPLAENRRNETSSGMSMIMSGAVKRSKRTLANIERQFMKPLVEKTAWRYMQLAPDRYPVKDASFIVHSTLGLIARELEQNQLATLMNTVPPESPAFWMLLKGVYENSSISQKEEMLPLIEEMLAQSIEKQRNPQPENPLVAVKMRELELESEIEKAKLQLKSSENQMDAQMDLERLKLEYAKLKLQKEEFLLDARVELAKMEQDSAVTAVQMAAKVEESRVKSGGDGVG